MSNTINLTLMSSSASENGGFIIKLQNKDTKELITPFGKKVQAVQQTYYMKVEALPKNMKVGASADLDLGMFKIVERDFELPDGDNAGEIVALKWLQIK